VTHIACAAAIAVLVTVAPAVLPGQQPIRIGVDLVNFGVVVTDRRGAPISGLTKDDFEVIERGKPQQIQFFSAGGEAVSPPLHLGFLLDASGTGYIYDASVDEWVIGRQLFGNAAQPTLPSTTGYFGPVAVGPRGQYFLANGLVFNPSLTQIGSATDTGGIGVLPPDTL